MGLQRGDEVIVPAFAFAAVAETVLLLGGVPVFADVDPRTFNIDPASVARLVSERTRVVIPVHLFGQPCDMAALTAVAKEHGLKVIEDNAQSLGAVCRMSDGASRYAGTIGEIGCTSFFPSKVLGCYGDGGAAITDDDVKRAAAALTVLAPKDELLMLRSFFDMYRGTAETEEISSAVVSVATAILRLDPKDGRAALEEATKDGATTDSIRPRLEAILASAPAPAKN